MNTTTPLIHVAAGSKSFKAGHWALQDIELKVHAGECVALLGASGSGKSTLLRTLCGLETFSNAESQVLIGGQALQQGGRLSSQVRSLRRETAIIFQQFNLVGRKSLLENTLSGCLASMTLWEALLGRFSAQQRRTALMALDSVGLMSLHGQRASTLSGGQQQRAAIARALTQNPSILLADEPVASLDPESTERVMGLLHHLNQSRGLTLVISLHDVDLARRFCHRVIALKDGFKVYDGSSASLSESVLGQLYGPQAAALHAGQPSSHAVRYPDNGHGPGVLQATPTTA